MQLSHSPTRDSPPILDSLSLLFTSFSLRHRSATMVAKSPSSDKTNQPLKLATPLDCRCRYRRRRRHRHHKSTIAVASWVELNRSVISQLGILGDCK
ncbi:hypothetical protein TIFTF001_009994 [Ficus carica]|uniref:Uncharacterized protein n=1 Tax=Ficus carica TaxID=3494 RepID=A0AA87ZQY3_FICCA|nr:hypothetical protein TIFTF001_009994 [Ficus carica]